MSVPKTVNVLDKLPKTLHSQAKSALHAIWQAEIKDQADKAFDRFIATYEAKYPKATGCLAKDRDELLAFYDFPAAHWQHLRTSNPIESTFATIRLRTAKTRNCVSAKSGSALLYQLAMSAQKRWRRLRGFRQLADVIAGVKFIDGIDERTINSRKAAGTDKLTRRPGLALLDRDLSALYVDASAHSERVLRSKDARRSHISEQK